ncbi:MAG: PilW family protein, partial [Synergistaceae bacterium]
MKSSAKTGFTLVELLIGVVMMTIVIAGIAFTVSSGFDLFTKADSNAVVISGVRFTADSFKRTVAPMLNVTDEIELLSEGSAIPASLSEDIHYVFLSNGSVVHRDSKGDYVLEGSEYIDNVEFSIPAASEDTQENYIFKMTINGKNSDHPNAKLDLDVESALYNRPEKKGTEVSGDIRGAILKIKASLYLDRLDLYDNDTKIKINGLTMHKGTKIEAVYDLINQTGTSQPMTDASIIEWFISGSVSADITVSEASPTDLNRNSYYWQLVSGGDPVTGKVLDTTGTFHLDTGATETDWEVGVIRCRVTPAVKSSGGSLVASGVPRWSDYVVIKAVEAPSEEFEEILDVLDPDSQTPNGTGDVFLTDVATQHNENVFDVNSGQILMTIDSPSKPGYGASFVMQLKHDKFDNDRIYGAWVAGRESASD